MFLIELETHCFFFRPDMTVCFFIGVALGLCDRDLMQRIDLSE